MKRSPAINLFIRVCIDKAQYRYVKPVYISSKRKNAPEKLKPFFAIVGGKEQHQPEGVYALRIGRNFETVGPDPEGGK